MASSTQFPRFATSPLPQGGQDISTEAPSIGSDDSLVKSPRTMPTQPTFFQKVYKGHSKRPPLTLSEIVVLSFKNMEQRDGKGVFYKKTPEKISETVLRLMSEDWIVSQESQSPLERLVKEEAVYASTLQWGESYNSFKRAWIHEFLKAFPSQIQSLADHETVLERLSEKAFEILASEKNEPCFSSMRESLLMRREVCLAFSEAVEIWNHKIPPQIEGKPLQSEVFESLAQRLASVYSDEGLQLIEECFCQRISIWSDDITKRNFRSWTQLEIESYLGILQRRFSNFLLVDREKSMFPSIKAREIQEAFETKIAQRIEKSVLDFRKQLGFDDSFKIGE